MSSHLRTQSSFQPFHVEAKYQTSAKLPAVKKQRMSLTQTYYIASSARSKLGREAARADHNLRRLVGHANLLDNLMVELADAEREQEAWFNQSVRKATRPQERHIQWIDTISETEDSDEEMDSEDEEDYNFSPRAIAMPTIVIESEATAEDELDDEDDEEHALIRVPSRHSTPELASDDSESEDESMPPSPETVTLEYRDKKTPSFFAAESKQGIEDYINQSQPMIASF